MNMRIALGAALLLALGSAVGSAAVKTHTDDANADVTGVSATDVTPETLAMWKATAATADYTPPRLPI